MIAVFVKSVLEMILCLINTGIVDFAQQMLLEIHNILECQVRDMWETIRLEEILGREVYPYSLCIITHSPANARKRTERIRYISVTLLMNALHSKLLTHYHGGLFLRFKSTTITTSIDPS